MDIRPPTENFLRTVQYFLICRWLRGTARSLAFNMKLGQYDALLKILISCLVYNKIQVAACTWEWFSNTVMVQKTFLTFFSSKWQSRLSTHYIPQLLMDSKYLFTFVSLMQTTRKPDENHHPFNFKRFKTLFSTAKDRKSSAAENKV